MNTRLRARILLECPQPIIDSPDASRIYTDEEIIALARERGREAARSDFAKETERARA